MKHLVFFGLLALPFFFQTAFAQEGLKRATCTYNEEVSNNYKDNEALVAEVFFQRRHLVKSVWIAPTFEVSETSAQTFVDECYKIGRDSLHRCPSVDINGERVEGRYQDVFFDGNEALLEIHYDDGEVTTYKCEIDEEVTEEE